MGLLYDLIFSVFVLTGLAATLGNYLDKQFHTTPWLAIVFGLTAIVFGLTRLVLKSNEISTKDENKNGNENK